MIQICRLKAENESDCREWIAQLESAIERHRQRLEGMESKTPSVHVENWEIDYSALTIVEKIGEGAFGEVFKGRLWGTDVAIKKIKNKVCVPTFTTVVFIIGCKSGLHYERESRRSEEGNRHPQHPSTP